METPLDVLSRAASFVHANEEESKFQKTHFLLFVCVSGVCFPLPSPVRTGLSLSLSCRQIDALVRANGSYGLELRYVSMECDETMGVFVLQLQIHRQIRPAALNCHQLLACVNVLSLESGWGGSLVSLHLSLPPLLCLPASVCHCPSLLLPSQ